MSATPAQADKPSDRLSAALASLPASGELREAALAEILAEQLRVVQSQRDVSALMDTTDQRLTATVQALRDENSKLAKLIGQASQAFMGELAARAADQARRAASEAIVDELARLRLAIEARERHTPVLRKPWHYAVGASLCVVCVLGAGLWLGVHLIPLPGAR